MSPQVDARVPHELCSALLAPVLLIAGGCVSFDAGYGYTRGWATKPGTLTVNGEPVEYNKTNIVRTFGPPAFTILVPEGEVCIWRDKIMPRIGKFTPSDYCIGFDANGRFRPLSPDPKSTYGFCPRCGFDAWRVESDHCPQCGGELSEDRPHQRRCGAASTSTVTQAGGRPRQDPEPGTLNPLP
ncbi:MAG: hypothetical protein AB1716_04155 [Planctomycetota bacterium]